MPGDYCDWEPCSWLQKFVTSSLLPRDRVNKTIQVDAFHRLARSNGKAGGLRRITFYYCPFCGTRLSGNIEILEWIQKKRGS